MKQRGIQLQYRFDASDAQRGAAIENPLFDLLSALAEAGSIQKAAQRLNQSYRHLWGSLKSWEATLGEPLVRWVRGQPARLTPFAERLLWAERRARTRLAPHIEALRGELQRVPDEAMDGTRQVLRVHASHDLALPALQELAGAGHGLHIELRFAASLDALRALAQGRCIVAGFHVPPLVERAQHYARAMKPLLMPGRHKLIGCMRRRQGLIVAAGNPLQLAGWPDLLPRGSDSPAAKRARARICWRATCPTRPAWNSPPCRWRLTSLQIAPVAGPRHVRDWRALKGPAGAERFRRRAARRFRSGAHCPR